MDITHYEVLHYVASQRQFVPMYFWVNAGSVTPRIGYWIAATGIWEFRRCDSVHDMYVCMYTHLVTTLSAFELHNQSCFSCTSQNTMFSRLTRSHCATYVYIPTMYLQRDRYCVPTYVLHVLKYSTDTGNPPAFPVSNR